MNSKKIVLLGCVAAWVFTASTATAQMRGHGGSMAGMGMHSGGMPHSMGAAPMRGGFMPRSMGRMPMHSAPMINSSSGRSRFGDRNFNGVNRFGRFNRFNDGRFVRNHRFHRFNHVNNIVFIGDFGFPWWWGWGWGPWWGADWGSPYGSYGYYGPGYGYGSSSGSTVAELQTRLARAGYYHGAIDGILGPATRRAIRAYERNNGYVS